MLTSESAKETLQRFSDASSSILIQTLLLMIMTMKMLVM